MKQLARALVAAVLICALTATAAVAFPENGLSLCFGITQSTDDLTVTGGNSASCNDGVPTYYHADNSYFRAFTLSDFGIEDDWTVDSVRIGVEAATSGSGTGQPLNVRLYTASPGTFASSPATINLVQSVATTIEDVSLALVTIPIPPTTIAAGLELIVEIHTPNGVAQSNSFFIGSNSAGQSAPSYFQAVDCGVTVPTATADIGRPDMHIVMTPFGCLPNIFVDGFESGDTSAWSSTVP